MINFKKWADKWQVKIAFNKCAVYSASKLYQSMSTADLSARHAWISLQLYCKYGMTGPWYKWSTYGTNSQLYEKSRHCWFSARKGIELVKSLFCNAELP